MGFYSHLSFSLSTSSIFLSVCLMVFLPLTSHFSLCSRVTVQATYRFPDLSPRTGYQSWPTRVTHSPVTELVSGIRACPLHSGLFEYYVRVHYSRGVGQAHRRIHHGGAVWNRRHRERRTAGGHHRVYRRASAHHLLYHRFLLSAQAWKTNRFPVKRLRNTVWWNTGHFAEMICKCEFEFATGVVRYTLW